MGESSIIHTEGTKSITWQEVTHHSIDGYKQTGTNQTNHLHEMFRKGSLVTEGDCGGGREERQRERLPFGVKYSQVRWW